MKLKAILFFAAAMIFAVGASAFAQTGAKDGSINMEAEYISGDVNGDGNIDKSDFIKLELYFSGEDYRIIKGAADITGDGKIDKRDENSLIDLIGASSTDILELNADVETGQVSVTAAGIEDNANVYIACFSEDKELMRVQSKRLKDGRAKADAELSDTYCVKAFIWNDKMQPYCESGMQIIR